MTPVTHTVAESAGIDRGQRGRTTIPAKVVARIAEQAASEATHVGAASGGVLGIGARRDFASNPSAQCDLYGNRAVIRLDLGVDYPAPLAEVVGSVRTHLNRRIPDLTGLDLDRLDVTVSWLRPGTPARRLR